MKPIPYADLHHLPEDERIKVIAKVVNEQKITTAVMVDDKKSVIERYRTKLIAAGVVIEKEFKGPVSGVHSFRVKPKNENAN